MEGLLAFFASASKFKSEFRMSALFESRKSHRLATNNGRKLRKPRKCLAQGVGQNWLDSLPLCFLGWLGEELKGVPLAVLTQLGGRTSQGYATSDKSPVPLYEARNIMSLQTFFFFP